MKKLLSLIFICSLTTSFCQTKDYSADVKSVDALITTLYTVISDEPNAPRDWDRFKNLLKPEGRLIPTRKSDGGELIIKALSPDEYIQLFQSRIPTGFFERELSRKTEAYGTLVHVF